MRSTVRWVLPEPASTATRTRSHGSQRRLASSTGEVADLALGEEVYRTTCQLCHGATGQGNNGGPAFSAGLTPEGVATIARDGRNAMPAFGAQLSAKDIVSVGAFVAQQFSGAR
ncbi:MAG: cytochrome c [Hyphomonadaceae bacterium]